MADADLMEKIDRLLRMAEARGSLPMREIYSRAEACVLLGGLSRRTLDRMVATGLITTCRLGLKERGGIPRSEIERLATPKVGTAPREPPPKGGRRGPKRRVEREAKDEAAAIRALAKRR